ncbi:MAG TPA: DUF309 domain-containing protein [Terracidiphilus sp.]|jgi:hypothetical protein
MPFDWTRGPLAHGLECYCSGQFFEAHEHWEAVWLECTEPEKTFLQSLIQVSAAFHHLARGNRAGARSLLTRALRRLERYPSDFGGIAVDGLKDSIRGWLCALQADAPGELPPHPRIRQPG